MRGVVKNVEFAYGFITGQDGAEYFAPAVQMPFDELGRRYLLPGEEVKFVPCMGEGRRQQAHDITLVTPRAPHEGHYVEEGDVCKVGGDGEYAFIRRPFGGVAMLHHRRVVSCKLRDIDNRPMFEPGQWWAFEIVKPKDTARPWLANKAREM
jgi:cold shock CspA family protein